MLKEESEELLAAMTHIREKIDALNIYHQELDDKRAAIDVRLYEARQAHKELAAQHLAAELIVVKNNITENSLKIKDLQREQYFVGLERKRKLGFIRTIKSELQIEKEKGDLKKKVEETIKKDGLLAALDLLSIESKKNKLEKKVSASEDNLKPLSVKKVTAKKDGKKKKKRKGSLAALRSKGKDTVNEIKQPAHAITESNAKEGDQSDLNENGSGSDSEEDDENDEDDEGGAESSELPVHREEDSQANPVVDAEQMRLEQKILRNISSFPPNDAHDDGSSETKLLPDETGNDQILPISMAETDDSVDMDNDFPGDIAESNNLDKPSPENMSKAESDDEKPVVEVPKLSFNHLDNSVNKPPTVSPSALHLSPDKYLTPAADEYEYDPNSSNSLGSMGSSGGKGTGSSKIQYISEDEDSRDFLNTSGVSGISGVSAFDTDRLEVSDDTNIVGRDNLDDLNTSKTGNGAVLSGTGYNIAKTLKESRNSISIEALERANNDD